ncbi:unnamed protein product [Dicrocoelium dendriticum]|nr:unnamed protein product [Dicrocoelium dendriticum]
MQWSTCEACYFALTATLTTCYIRHWQHDLGAEERGSHPWKTMRHLNIWEQLANYFPIQLILSEELLECVESRRRTTVSAGDWQPYTVAGLPADRNYLVGYHPHGVFSTGAFVNFMTEANEFSKVFPGLTPWLATLKAHFKSPFYREYLMSLGMVSASKRSLQYLLDEKERKCTGNFVIVVVGGATEALEAHPRHYRMVVTKRFGFFKLALQTGSTLIPCLSFGEQAMYNQIPNEPGTRLRRFQDWFESVCTFSPPLFYARGLIPYRTPVNTVVGAPIPCKRIEDPTPKQVCEVKQMYLDSLQGLFWKYKSVYDPKAEDIVFL